MSPADIRHVVVLVLENQSFDRMLGYVTLPDPRQKLDWDHRSREQSGLADPVRAISSR
jgi:Phospholipase C